MHALKKLTIGIWSKVDEVVVKVENHDALVTTAIRELQQEMGEAKARLGRVRKDGARMTHTLETARENATLWRKRAAEMVADDEKAMECLKRSKKEAAAAARLEARLVKHREAEDHLAETIALIERKLDALKEKRNILRTRQTRADALKFAGSDTESFGEEVEEILERWESKIERHEYTREQGEPIDELEREFTTREEQAELIKELDELRGK